MCYSAEVWADYRMYMKEFAADLGIREFLRLFGTLDPGGKWYVPKAMLSTFEQARADADDMREINAIINAHAEAESQRLEKELFTQKSRLNEAERKLLTKETKSAREVVRIASNKIHRAKGAIDDLRRTQLEPRDTRIFPGWYAPVMISDHGRRVIVPMRYGCRPAGKPANYDQRFPGTYNARRDNLEGFWKNLFGYTHGLMVCTRFYENVEGADGKNQVVQFTPRTGDPLYIACLWSHWIDPKGHEPDLYSFAAITDEPEPEVAAAGHDRTIINIKPEHVDAWLEPNSKDLAKLYAVFNDKRHPYYEHRLAA